MRKPSCDVTNKTVLASLLIAAAAPMAGSGLKAGESAVYGGGSIADSEIASRMDRVAQANSAYERGVKAGQRGDNETAVRELRDALEILPYGPRTEEHRAIISEAYNLYALRYADEISKQGRVTEARTYVEGVLDIDPENRRAKALLARLDEGTLLDNPGHFENVEEVSQLLKEARSSYNLGKFDEAQRTYHEVLRIDRHNTAASRGLESVANEKTKYYEAAYLQTRGEMIRRLDEAWALPIPQVGVGAGAGGYQATEDSGLGYITTKLNEIIIPEFNVSNITLDAAIELLRQRSRELDTIETDDSRKGVNINIYTQNIDQSSPGARTEPISVSLSNNPLAEVLRTVCDLAGVKYRVDPHSVIVVPLADTTARLGTRTFRVPPSFTQAGGAGGGAVAAADPFATPDAGGTDLGQRRTAMEVLQEQGITFDTPGAIALYNPSTSELTVRNTAQNLDQVDELVRGYEGEGVPKQVRVETKFVEIRQDNLSELGFDWVLGGWGLGSGDRVMGGGGSVGGSGRSFGNSEFPFFGQSDLIDGALNPVTAGLRSGNESIVGSAIDALIASGRIGAVADVLSPAPGVFTMAGVLTDPQFQVMLRALDQKTGTDLLSAPTILAANGEAASIEVIRELIYPTEYDPPELPQNVGVTTVTLPPVPGTPVTPGSFGNFPVTPATPAEFTTRNTGVTLQVTPQIGPDGYTVSMSLSPEVVEFEGFINYGSPITSGGTDLLGNPITVEITQNRIEMPVFATRKVTTNVTVWDGQTVAIGGLIREDVQHTQDKVPILGDLPYVGRLFRIEAEERLKRNLMIFVTASLVDPAGNPIHAPQEEVFDDGPDPSLFPPAEPVYEGYGKNVSYK